MIKFCIQAGYTGREAFAVISSCHDWGADYNFSTTAEAGCIPIGTVEFCSPVFGKEPVLKNFYPEFTAPLLKRNVRLKVRTEPQEATQDVFVKDALGWKTQHVSHVYEQGELLPIGSFLESEVTTFHHEWRFYIAEGEVITASWYLGLGEEKEPPVLRLEIPKNFSGTLDIGERPTGQLELVECHAPYACGWYGESKDNDLYSLWQILAWENRSFWLA